MRASGARLAIRRREFIALIGAVAWLPAATAQQTLPTIGYLSSGSPDKTTSSLQAFRRGLSEAGYEEGRNVAIEYRWGDGYGRSAEMASDLVQRKVAAIVAVGGVPSAQAAKSATTTIPIIFAVGGDPVAFGIVSSLSRPTGNITGVTNFNHELGQKRLELLHEMMPGATRIGLLVNPATALADPMSESARTAAQAMGLQLHIFQAANEQEIATAFAGLGALHADALIVGADAYFAGRSEQIASLAGRNGLAFVGSFRNFARAGALITYGGSLDDQFHSVGIYTGQILAGKRPAELPVQQSTKLELTINLKTAKTLGLDMPESILARADEVIE
jgi:putative ABC transport system substrate-binding protein